ncbi:MAG: hypothetical protein WBA93_11875 [Microcoleaceae cyanobacterium]
MFSTTWRSLPISQPLNRSDSVLHRFAIASKFEKFSFLCLNKKIYS